MSGLDVTRKKGERLIVVLPNSDEIVFQYNGQNSNYSHQAMINVQAPPAVKIYREEILDQIKSAQAGQTESERSDNRGNK